MSYRRGGLRALGLCFVAVLGLMALSAPAQGAAGSFLVLGKAIPAGLLPIIVTGELDTLGLLLVPALNVEIDCTSFDVVEGKLTSASEGTAKLLYLGCVYRQLGDLTKGLGANCKIKSGGVEGDITASYTLKAILAGGLQLLILGRGNAGGPTGDRIALLESTGCSVPEKVEVRGTMALKLSSDNAVKQLITEANEATQLVLGDLLRYGANHAFIDGGAWVQLDGVHLGCTWSSI